MRTSLLNTEKTMEQLVVALAVPKTVIRTKKVPASSSVVLRYASRPDTTGELPCTVVPGGTGG
jgi:hypothetical protein